MQMDRNGFAVQSAASFLIFHDVVLGLYNQV